MKYLNKFSYQRAKAHLFLIDNDNFLAIMFLYIETKLYMENLQKISKLVKNLRTEAEVERFFKELLTKSEIETLSKRWRILDLLAQGSTQRDIAKELKVSLCKVTRGAKILKDKNSTLSRHLIKEKNNGNN